MDYTFTIGNSETQSAEIVGLFQPRVEQANTYEVYGADRETYILYNYRNATEHLLASKSELG